MISMHVQEDLRLLPLTLTSWWTPAPVSAEVNERLREFARIELRKENAQGDQEQLRRDEVLLREIAWRTIIPRLGSVFAVVMSPPWHKSRIRSYKGLFWGSKSRGASSREREVDLGEQSYFLGVVRVDKNNHWESMLKAPRPYYTFSYAAATDDFNSIAEKLFSEVPHFVCRHVDSFFQMPLLVSCLIDKEEVILQLGVDSSAEPCAELRVYTKLQNRSLWEQALAKQLEAVDPDKATDINIKGEHDLHDISSGECSASDLPAS
jgi:hypothetical protein